MTDNWVQPGSQFPSGTPFTFFVLDKMGLLDSKLPYHAPPVPGAPHHRLRRGRRGCPGFVVRAQARKPCCIGSHHTIAPRRAGWKPGRTPRSGGRGRDDAGTGTESLLRGRRRGCRQQRGQRRQSRPPGSARRRGAARGHLRRRRRGGTVAVRHLPRPGIAPWCVTGDIPVCGGSGPVGASVYQRRAQFRQAIFCVPWYRARACMAFRVLFFPVRCMLRTDTKRMEYKKKKKLCLPSTISTTKNARILL